MFAGITAGSDQGIGRMRKYKGVDVQLSKAPMQIATLELTLHCTGYEDNPFPYRVATENIKD